ncbi:protein transporter [Pseudozyma hubeiensis SY62]|uniref:Protein transporter n=1 Tax=Pseudozyma hubeiensis (strain SY62) TaxID=1305764 RepID=R9PBS7_PSEHS|nr:protein transporter [Pseudozyma hubeiensis SY62]GAC98697.1 protein transporter [Pseudozyma hubeiensis SY62]
MPPQLCFSFLPPDPTLPIPLSIVITSAISSMPEAVSTAETATDGEPSTPLSLLRAVTEVQERRISIWREYDDAFDQFLDPAQSSSTSAPAPVNGSQNNDSSSTTTNGRGCAGCSTTTVPLSSRLLAQILQLTTQALIECGHRLRAIQTELSHSTHPELATLVDRIQSKENALLRNVVQRDQLRKTIYKPDSPNDLDRDNNDSQTETLAQLETTIDEIRSDITELMQDVYAESLDLQQ